MTEEKTELKVNNENLDETYEVIAKAVESFADSLDHLHVLEGKVFPSIYQIGDCKVELAISYKLTKRTEEDEGETSE